MPIHNWTRVPAGIFHDFHHEWITSIKHSLNRLLRGTDYYALAEQIAGGIGPDVLTLKRPVSSTGRRSGGRRGGREPVGTALATSPPKLRFRITDPPLWYANKKKAITIRHISGHDVVAAMEIVSPGNKASMSAFSQFVRKTQELIAAGVHISVVDLFPPTPRDPEGIHVAIWHEDRTETFTFDKSKPLTCASYLGGFSPQAFVEPVGFGDALPTIPIFLTPDEYVPVQLEETYLEAFAAVPEVWQSKLKPKK